MKNFWKYIEENIIKSREDSEYILKNSFENAKQFSDFIGMVTRMLFLAGIVAYLLKHKNTFGNIYLTTYATGTFILFYIILYQKISRLILDYFMFDVSEIKKGKGKLFVFILGIVTAFIMPLIISFSVISFIGTLP